MPSRTRIQAEQAYESGRDAYQRQSWAAAAKSFERAADVFASIDDYPAEATARHNHAQSLRRAGQLDEAVAAFQKALAINQRLDRKSEQAQNLAGLAQCYRAENKIDLALHSGEDALKLAGGAPTVRATIQNDLALTLLQRGSKDDLPRVISLLQAALETNEKMGGKRAVAVNRLNLGRAYLQSDEKTRAQAELDKALGMFRSLGDPSGLAHAHEFLAKLCLARGDREKAAFHLEQAREKYSFLKDEAGLRRLEGVKLGDR